MGILITMMVLLFWYLSQRENEDGRVDYNLKEEAKQDKALQDLLATENDNIKQKLVPFGILTYHHIGPNAKGNYNRWCVYPKIFSQQIEDLKNAGYHFVTLAEAMEKFQTVSSTTIPFQKTIVLTFDDGYRDFYTVAYPFLKKNKIPATLFVITQDIGHAGNVTWDMIKEMQASGLVEIGSHTVHHKNLLYASEKVIRSEIFDSKKILEEKLGTKIKTFAYPYGTSGPTAIRLVQEAGYIGGVRVLAGQKPTSANMYVWRRMIAETNDVGEKFLKKIYNAFVVLK
ncbi:MAG: polysaccharide deacetylase family protein [bacterium]|nr:polysaccharide deacetylase family protein [bacterium]